MTISEASVFLSTSLQASGLWIGVYMPLVLSVAALLFFNSETKKSLAFTLPLIPLVVLGSWSDANGVHIVPLQLLGILYLAARGSLTKTDAFGVAAAIWVSTVIADFACAYIANTSMGPAYAWYGLGGDGFEDGLVTMPVLCTAIAFLAQRLVWSGKVLPATGALLGSWGKAVSA